MRDQLQNPAIAHHIRRVVSDILRGVPGGGLGGGPGGFNIWKRIAGVTKLVNQSDTVEVGDLQLAQLFFTELLRNAADGTSDGIGGLFLPSRSEAASFGSTQNDLDLGAGIFHVIQPTAANLKITGIVPPAGSTDPGGSTGCVKVLISDGDYGFQIPHNDLGSSGANRFITPYAIPLDVPAGPWETRAHAVLLYYTGEPSPMPLRWHAYPFGFIPAVVQGADDGSLWRTGKTSEEIVIAAAATSDSVANLLPADAIIAHVVCRVRVAIPTAATFNVGTSASAQRFDNSVSVALNTTSVGLNHHKGSVTTENDGPTQRNAMKIRITPNATPANGDGRVEVTVFYKTATPPTS